VRLTANKGQVSNGAWRGWIGTAVLASPYTTTGDGSYCLTSNWDFSLKGQS
jgi:hypothetical protein